MCPETAMKYTNGSDLDALLEEWLNNYAELMDEFHEREELIGMLSERICHAFSLLSEGKTGDAPSLDGDFPLGNDYDMRFASKYFDIQDLVNIQAGLPWYQDKIRSTRFRRRPYGEPFLR